MEIEKIIGEERIDVLNDLYLVGKTKSLGYLPLETLMACDVSVSDIVIYSKENNLNYLLLEEGECNTFGGALYLFHERMLFELLLRHALILEGANIPYIDVVEYIKYISLHLVDSETYPEAYAVIGKTFNDKRFHLTHIRCETCEKEKGEMLYSYTLGKWQCEACDDVSAEQIWCADE